MIRTPWLAALLILVTPGRGPGQDLADEPPRAVGLRMIGAFVVEQGNEGHKVRIEMEGGQTLEGLIDSQPFIVDGDLGQYTIWPTKIRTIQFLKRSNVEDEPEPEPKLQPQPIQRNPQAMGMGGMGGGMRAGGMGGGMMGGGMMGGGMMMRQPTLIRGKVTTTTGKIIIGDIHIRPNFSLTLDFGILNVAPEKLRTLTVIHDDDDDAQRAEPQNSSNGKPKSTGDQQSRPQGNNPSGRSGGNNGSKRPDQP